MAEASADTTYSYSHRPRPLSAQCFYRLEPDKLAWSTNRSQGHIAYGDVEQLQIFKSRFLGASKSYWNCVLRSRSGSTIRLGAADRVGLRAVEDRSESYIPFVKELEARVIAANPEVRVVAGRNWLNRLETIVGRLTIWILAWVRRRDLERAGNVAGWLMRKIGPWLRGHRVARSQLVVAFPEKTPAEIEKILVGMWDNIGRVAVEYAHFDRLWQYDPDHPEQSRIVMTPEVAARFERFKVTSGPTLMASAHYANWEISPLAAPAAGREISLVFRAPNIGPIMQELNKARSSLVAAVIRADRNTPVRVREEIKRGRMVGMLVDQHYASGVEVTMFNRRCKLNPMFGRFARLFECPVHLARVIRLPKERFQFEVSEPLELPRDAEGKIDVEGTMQVIASALEGWVREHPEQWLWLHRHWR